MHSCHCQSTVGLLMTTMKVLTHWLAVSPLAVGVAVAAQPMVSPIDAQCQSMPALVLAVTEEVVVPPPILLLPTVDTTTLAPRVLGGPAPLHLSCVRPLPMPSLPLSFMMHLCCPLSSAVPKCSTRGCPIPVGWSPYLPQKDVPHPQC
jgi:hypothetical protein